MARIDAAAVNPERQWVSPADVVDAAVAHVAPALADHTLEIDADGLAEIQVDPRLTSSALAHVLENAARYSPDEAPIAVRAWTEADGGHFIVRDHGPGLDASDLDHLFEPFYRGAKTAARHGHRPRSRDHPGTAGGRRRPRLVRERAGGRRAVHDRGASSRAAFRTRTRRRPCRRAC